MVSLPRGKLLAATSLVILLSISFFLLVDVESTSHSLSSSLSSLCTSASLSSNPSAAPLRCPSSCPSDPFSSPGMIHFGPNRTETRWVPFPRIPIVHIQSSTDDDGGIAEGGGGEEDDFVTISQMNLEERVSEEVLERAGPPYLRWLVDGELEKLEFLRGRSIVLIGSSHDRNNVQQVCDESKGKYNSWGGHAGGICTIPQLNLTIANWFTYGMVDTEEAFDEWKGKWEDGPGVFANRVEKVFVPKMAAAGLSRRPDLVIVASLFWDDSFLGWNRGNAKFTSIQQHGWTFQEMAWHRSRVHSTILSIRQHWGHDLPLMFRTRQLRKMDSNWSLLKIFQLDQSCRAVAKELDVKLFTWGGKLEGFSQYYDDDQHFALGPSTYIFGDMLFFYVHRAITEGCWGCHQWDD